MPVEFKLPDVGEGIAEGEIVRWLVSEGDTVSEDQPVVEIETDKALVEIPSPVDGQVREFRAQPGEVVPVGTVIVVFEEVGDTDTAESSESSGTPTVEESGDDVGSREGEGSGVGGETGKERGRVFASPSVRQLARESDVNLEDVTGTGPGGRITESDVQSYIKGSGESPASELPESSPAAGTGSSSGREDGLHQTQTTSAGGARSRTLAAPATRRIANELGVDINAVPAVEHRDGEAFVTPEAVREHAEAGAHETTMPIPSSTDQAERQERIPYRGLRRTIGQQMERSAFTAPHVTHHDMADATALVDLRSELRDHAEERGTNLTYLPFVLKSVVGALKEFPQLNAELDKEAEEIVHNHYYNIGFATATDAGLMVPVIENVDEKSMLELAGEAADLAEKARDRSITREEMQGGTFTITNFGAIGGEYATPIINYPEVAILGLGAIQHRPRVVDGSVEPRWTIPLSLSIDHRVVDGADAARFTNRVIEYLEQPSRLILE